MLTIYPFKNLQMGLEEGNGVYSLSTVVQHYFVALRVAHYCSSLANKKLLECTELAMWLVSVASRLVKSLQCIAIDLCSSQN